MQTSRLSAELIAAQTAEDLAWTSLQSFRSDSNFTRWAKAMERRMIARAHYVRQFIERMNDDNTKIQFDTERGSV